MSSFLTNKLDFLLTKIYKMHGNIEATNIVKQYLEEFPELPSLTLAKLIYKNNPVLFTDVEFVRNKIRTYRGSRGVHNRNALQDRRYYREIQAPYNPFELPESDEMEFEPYNLPDLKKLLIFGDVHIPYYSIDSLSRMIEYALPLGIDGIILNGDIIDFYHLSVFTKDPLRRHFVEEIEITILLLKKLKEIFNCQIFFKYGNHEERYEHYLRLKAPEMIGTKAFRLNEILMLDEIGIDYIKDKRTVKFGKLNILHGHELKGGIIAPVNPARGVFLRAKENTIVNHFHSDSKHSEPTLNNSHLSCWSIGCMCDLHPEYAPNNRWVHGFGIVEMLDDNGSFTVETKQIINQKIV